MDFPGGSDSKVSAYNVGAAAAAAAAKSLQTCVQFLVWEDLLEKEMATHSSIHAWKIPWMEEPGRLQSMGCKKSDTTEHVCSHIHVSILPTLPSHPGCHITLHVLHSGPL